MKYFYLFPPSFLVLLLMLYTVTIIFHVSLMIHEFLHQSKKRLFFDFVLFLYLLEMIFILADIAECAHEQLVWILPHYRSILFLLWILLILGTVRSLYAGYKQRLIVIPLTVFLTLPVSEDLSGRFFPYLLLCSSVILFVYSGFFLLVNLEKYENSLSSMSIKEAIDSLSMGLLFYETKHHHKGQIVLANLTIQKLMYILTGKFYYNGSQFYDDLKKGEVLSSCKQLQIKDALAYELPNGRVWSFEQLTLEEDLDHRLLLVATDITKIWEALTKVYSQNQELLQKNKELQEMLKNLENICRDETLLQYKVKVHNILGQKLSVMMQALREQKEPSKEFLISLLKSIEEELKNPSMDFIYSLDSLKKSFQGIDVELKIDGQLPTTSEIAKCFFEVITEACTNAVRHGYASVISIKLGEGKPLTLDIENNGRPPKDEITEGGGLTEMRRKIHLLNGTFSYTTSPWFHIHIEV